MGVKKLIIQLSFPSDEVGNELVNNDIFYGSDVSLTDSFTGDEFNNVFSTPLHPFTGINYINMYKEYGGNNCEIIVSNDPREMLKYTKNIICADIHTRNRTKAMLMSAGAEKIYTLCDILNKSRNGSGYNSLYGLLGSNKSTDNRIKLFPEKESAQKLVEDIQKRLKGKTGKTLGVMIYGDGAFKDPVGKIWELADPVVSPAYTSNLEGTPNEIKLKYLSDNKFADLKGDELADAIRNEIKTKNADLKGTAASLGTTPRRYTDLLGSLADLTSGSGDKGTPVILIQNYFDNYAD